MREQLVRLHADGVAVGAVLPAGTGIVPGESFTSTPDEVAVIDAPGLGVLTNPVVLGRDRTKEDR